MAAKHPTKMFFNINRSSFSMVTQTSQWELKVSSLDSLSLSSTSSLKATQRASSTLQHGVPETKSSLRIKSTQKSTCSTCGLSPRQ